MPSPDSPTSRRWVTALLVIWLPLAKWGLPPGPLRLLAFYGGGCALATLAVWREGDWPRLRPLFGSPGRGLWEGVTGYATLVAGATLLLYLPLIQPFVPFPLYDLASRFDPMRVYLAWARGDLAPALPAVLGVMLGAVLEEAIFRAALFWRWAAARADADGRLPPLGTVLRLAAVSGYFAALHWPQPPGALVVALLGALVAGAVLWRWRSFAMVAALHALFNAHQVL